MRFELEPIEYTLRVYDDHAENYVAVALVRVYGDRAWVSSISSPRLFEAMPEHFSAFMDQLGAKTLEGYMSKAMARAVRMASRNWAKFEITHTGQMAGREMPWVVLSRKEL
jgi:hypothetical protein